MVGIGCRRRTKKLMLSRTFLPRKKAKFLKKESHWLATDQLPNEDTFWFDITWTLLLKQFHLPMKQQL